jgi:hypothetical protein
VRARPGETLESLSACEKSRPAVRRQAPGRGRPPGGGLTAAQAWLFFRGLPSPAGAPANRMGPALSPGGGIRGSWPGYSDGPLTHTLDLATRLNMLERKGVPARDRMPEGMRGRRAGGAAGRAGGAGGGGTGAAAGVSVAGRGGTALRGAWRQEVEGSPPLVDTRPPVA